MKKKCLNCGSTDFVNKKGVYYCSYCRKRFDEDEYNKVLENEEKDLEDFTAISQNVFNFNTSNITKEEIDEYYSTMTKEKIEKIQEDEFRKFLEEQNERYNNYNDAKIEFLLSKEDVEKNGKSLASLLEVRDYITAAGNIYSNIEKNLIYKYKLEHKGTIFVIDINEFYEIINSVSCIDEDNPFMFWNKALGKYTLIRPTRINHNSNLVKMSLPIRFFKTGMAIEDIKTATEYWKELNAIRHRNPETTKTILEMCVNEHIYTEDAFDERFRKIIDFFIDRNLYIKVN